MDQPLETTTKSQLRIGVLALQGAFAEHLYSLQRAFEQLKLNGEHHTQILGTQAELNVVEVRTPEQLSDLDGLILPGGESTTASKFLTKAGFEQQLQDYVRGNGKKANFTWGTCAGLILLANRLEDMKTGGQLKIGGLDVTVTRNSYGRQNESFETALVLHNEELKGKGSPDYPGVFIRAPGIKSIEGAGVEILATLRRNDTDIPVAVHQENIMATSFHPELTDDLRWHIYFIRQAAQRKAARS